MVAPERFKINLAEFVLRKRESLQISQREFARRAGIPSHSTIAAWEKGDYLDYPERETLEKAASKIYGITVEDLMELLDPPKERQISVNSITVDCEHLTSEEDCLEIIKFLIGKIEHLKKQTNSF